MNIIDILNLMIIFVENIDIIFMSILVITLIGLNWLTYFVERTIMVILEWTKWIMSIVQEIKLALIMIVLSGCTVLPNGKLIMEFESEKNKMKISHDKIIFERVIAKWWVKQNIIVMDLI